MVPAASPAATVNIFIVEPGSNLSASAWARRASGSLTE